MLRRASPCLALGALLGGVALWLALRRIDLSELRAALRAVNYVWVGASQLSVVLTTRVMA